MDAENEVHAIFPQEGTTEQKNERWQLQVQEITRRHQSQKNKFCSELRADGTLLYNELLKRLGTHKTSTLVALEYGMLSGVAPVEEVAFEIEKLAKQLPESLRPIDSTIQ